MLPQVPYGAHPLAAGQPYPLGHPQIPWPAAAGPSLAQTLAGMQHEANAALAAVLQAQAAANMGAVGRAGALDALTALRLNNVLAAVFQTVMGGQPAFPLSPLDMPFYRAMLNESDISLMASLAGLGGMRGIISRLAALALQAPRSEGPWPGGAGGAGPGPLAADVAGAVGLAAPGAGALSTGPPPPASSAGDPGSPGLQGCVFCGAAADLVIFRSRLVCKGCCSQLQGGAGGSGRT